ncbi:MAG TPA: DUF1292 domain-containing protein [Clostridia bacterium]|nr:DUF1292 domain-containing protein [Clostridia bacterium]
MEDKILELIDEENQKKKFELIETIEYDDKKFAILAPLEDSRGEAIVCEIIDKGSEMIIKPVDDQNLLEIIEQLYDEMD